MITKKDITIADLLTEIHRELKKMKKKPEEVYLSRFNSYTSSDDKNEILAHRDDGLINGRSPSISISYTEGGN